MAWDSDAEEGSSTGVLSSRSCTGAWTGDSEGAACAEELCMSFACLELDGAGVPKPLTACVASPQKVMSRFTCTIVSVNRGHPMDLKGQLTLFVWHATCTWLSFGLKKAVGQVEDEPETTCQHDACAARERIYIHTAPCPSQPL